MVKLSKSNSLDSDACKTLQLTPSCSELFRAKRVCLGQGHGATSVFCEYCCL